MRILLYRLFLGNITRHYETFCLFLTWPFALKTVPYVAETVKACLKSPTPLWQPTFASLSSQSQGFGGVAVYHDTYRR